MIALVALAAGCVDRAAIALDPREPVHAAEHRLQDQLQPGAACLLAVGSAPSIPGGRRVRITAGGAAIEATAACDARGQQAMLQDHRVSEVVLVKFRRGRFVASSPADTSAEAELPADARPGRGAVFADPHPDGSAEDVIRALGALVQRFLIVIWDLAA
jgi:hypothetical protein